MTTDRKSLADDSSGAIMVMGVFMAVLLVGFMYYLIGVGETIFYRERMQDAADAGSWAAAVTSARGMNAIVMINLIMAALVAVLLAIKVILFIIQVGMVISGIMCAIPWTAAIGCPILDFLSDIEPDVQDVHDEVQNIVKEVVPILNKAEHAIAIATPLLAEAKAIKTMAAFTPPVDSGLSGVMIPGTLGLPVEDDTCDVLVAHAKRDLQGIVEPVLRAMGPLGPIVGQLIGLIIDAAEAVEGSVCGSGSGTGDAGQSIADQYKANQLHEMGCDGDDPPDACSHVGECGSTHASCDSGSGTVAGADAGSTDGFAPMRVKTDCNLGAECTQVRTVAFGTPNFDRTMQGVQAGNWGRDDGGGSGVYTMLQELAKGSVAEAEFYWDSHGDGDPDPQSDTSSSFPDAQGMRDDWMWEMNWRARLRRFHIPADSLFGSSCTGGPCGALVGAADMLNSVVVH